MATYSKCFLSGSANGKAIKVAATSSPGTTIHTAVEGTTDIEEIWLYAVNGDTTARKLTIEWGEITAPDGNIELTIAPESGLVLIVPGLLLQNGLNVKAFCSQADTVMIHGYVHRITA